MVKGNQLISNNLTAWPTEWLHISNLHPACALFICKFHGPFFQHEQYYHQPHHNESDSLNHY